MDSPSYKKYSLLFALLCNLAGTPAHAEGYVEGFGGLSSLPPSMQHDQAYWGDPASNTGLNRYAKPGLVAGLRGGFYRGMWGGEVEVMQAKSTLEQLFIESCDQQSNGDCINHRRSLMAGRHLSVQSVAIHALMRYEGRTWQPFVGVGPAYFSSKLSGDDCGWVPARCGKLASPYADSTRHAAAPGFSGKAGVLYKLNDRWGLSLTYQFQYAKFLYDGTQRNPGDATGHNERLTYTMQSITAGVRYSF